MDVHPAPFPGKLRASNMKTNMKPIPEDKKEAPFPRQKRVFGTIRNTNVQVKIHADKPVTKPTSRISGQQPRNTVVKPRVTKGQRLSPQLAETKKFSSEAASNPAVIAKLPEAGNSTHGIVSSPTRANINATEGLTNAVVSSPAVKGELVEKEELSNSVAFSPAVEAKCAKIVKLTGGVVSSPAVKIKLVGKEGFTNAVGSRSAFVKTKLVEKVESTDGVGSSPTKAKMIEKEEPSKVVGCSPAVKAAEKKPSGKSKSRSRKNVCFREAREGKNGQEEIHTPIASPSLVRHPRVSGTPYHTAENCSKCRLHKLESSSYWITQIKLAESVDKHFVSATFFRLALQCNAEPVRSLRIELRSYLARQTSLSKETEWRNISLSYGLLKGESDVSRLDSAIEIASGTSEISTTDDLGQEQQNIKNGLDEKDIAEGIENRYLEAFMEAK